MLGRNVKITLPRSARPEVHALCAALGLPLDSAMTDLDIAATGSGRIGFAYVADGDALTPAQMRLAPWLEILVDDVDGVAGRLDQIGLARIDYVDKDHPYFAGPGGVTFRLARA